MRKRTRTAALLLGLILTVNVLTACGPKRTTKEVEATVIGVDVARYQGTIDWNTLKETGINFAMIRLGYRGSSDGSLVEDKNARYNLQEATKAGIPVGAYFFSTAISEEEAIEEAKWAAEVMAKYPITYPVAFDCEGFKESSSRQYGMDKEERTGIALAFLKTIEKLGYEGMFYASKNELNADWNTDKIAKHYKIWVAQYPAEPYPRTKASSYEGEHAMWQYTKEGVISGIRQPVDLNVAYFSYDGIEPAKDPTPAEEVGPDVEAMMTFQETSDLVTAKSETNLRSVPAQDETSEILYTLKNGEMVSRVGVSASGWSKLLWNGQTVYAVSSYLVSDTETPTQSGGQDRDGDGIVTEFTPSSGQVTAKEMVNLRSLPSVEREDAEIIAQLKNGDVAECLGVSQNGWSKLSYQGQICYAVSSYLTPVSGAEETEPEEIRTQFQPADDRMTPKEKVNLRSIPSVEDPRCKIVATIYHGDIVIRNGVNEDVGWSRVEYQGQTLYCVSSMLESAPESASETTGGENG